MKFLSSDPIKERDLSPPTRGVWIEICPMNDALNYIETSPPTRGVWIEMTMFPMRLWLFMVTPHAGGVD